MSRTDSRAKGGGGRWGNDCDNFAGARPALDPARDALLAAIGIRHRAPLGDVPLPLLESWRGAVAHPGFARRFRDPAAFAYTQLRAELPPPGAEELDRWASHQGGQVCTIAVPDDAAWEQLLADARTLAPGADLTTLQIIAELRLDGRSPAAAVREACALTGWGGASCS